MRRELHIGSVVAVDDAVIAEGHGQQATAIGIEFRGCVAELGEA